MANYLLVYHGGPGMPETPAEGERVLKQWNDWFTDLGGAIVDGGNPATHTRRVQANGSVSDDAAGPSGYSVIRADSIDAAVALAKGCPVLDTRDASVQVVETINAM